MNTSSTVHRFQPGNSASPGRPKGAKAKHSIINLREQWSKAYDEGNGLEVLKELIKSDPIDFMRMGVALAPKDIKVELSENSHEAYILARDAVQAEIIKEGSYKIIEAEGQDVESLQQPDNTQITTQPATIQDTDKNKEKN